MNSFIQKEQLFLELCLLNVGGAISIVIKFKTYEVSKPERLNKKKKSPDCATILLQNLDSLHRF